MTPSGKSEEFSGIEECSGIVECSGTAEFLEIAEFVAIEYDNFFLFKIGFLKLFFFVPVLLFFLLVALSSFGKQFQTKI